MAIYFVGHEKHEKAQKRTFEPQRLGDTEKKEEHGDFAYYIQPKRPNEIRKMPFSRKDKSQKVTKKYFSLKQYLRQTLLEKGLFLRLFSENFFDTS